MSDTLLVLAPRPVPALVRLHRHGQDLSRSVAMLLPFRWQRVRRSIGGHWELRAWPLVQVPLPRSVVGLAWTPLSGWVLPRKEARWFRADRCHAEECRRCNAPEEVPCLGLCQGRGWWGWECLGEVIACEDWPARMPAPSPLPDLWREMCLETASCHVCGAGPDEPCDAGLHG
jgi:hypothetical protein